MIEKILVKLEANVKDYVKGMEEADKQQKKTGESISDYVKIVDAADKQNQQTSKSTKQHSKNMEKAGKQNQETGNSVKQYVAGMGKAEDQNKKTDKSAEDYTDELNKIDKQNRKTSKSTKDYSDDMEKADDQNNESSKSSNKIALMMGKVGVAAKAVAIPIAGMAVGVMALGSALTAMSLNAASNRKELERYARQAKTSTGEFQALAFATKQFGLDADSVADITKDLSDRFGEFATAGSGAFQDFADVMGLSAREARVAAVEFSKMSGRDALQAMVTQLENAGATGDQMTFVLESMGSELSRLTPLFTKNGEELKRLEERYKSLTANLSISDQQADDLKDLSESFDLINEAVGKASTAIGARFAPYLNNMINSVINVIPEATNTVIDFFNSFVKAENLRSVQDADAQIKNTTDSIIALEEKLSNVGSLGTLRKGVNVSDQKAAIEQKLEAEREHLMVLELKKEVLEKETEEYKLQNVIKRQGGEISAGTDGKISTGTGGDAVSNFDKEEAKKRDAKTQKGEDELQAIFDQQFAETEVEREAEQARIEMLNEFAMTRTEAIVDQYIKEMGMLTEYQLAVGASDKDLAARRLEIAKKFNNDVSKIKSDEVKTEEEAQKKKATALDAGLQVAKLVGAAMFADNKAVQAGLIIADTASAIMKSLSISPYDYANVAVIAATGAIQLSNALSASKGGGSTSGASSGSGGGGGLSRQQPQNFVEETTSLELTEQTENGITTQRLVLSLENGQDLFDAIIEGTEQRKRTGR
jgi:hypothetical protein